MGYNEVPELLMFQMHHPSMFYSAERCTLFPGGLVWRSP